MRSKAPIVGVHLPKSGGTSILQSLRRQFEDRGLFDYGRGPLGPHAHEVETTVPPSMEIVYGHFRPGRYDALGETFRFTVLREPVDLLMSFYFFWKTLPYQGLPLHRRFLDEQPLIEDFAAWPPIRTLSSQTFFGGYDMDRFDFIGFHETRHADLIRLNALAGLQIDQHARENITAPDPVREDLKADTRRLRGLADTLAPDVRFYDRIRSARA